MLDLRFFAQKIIMWVMLHAVFSKKLIEICIAGVPRTASALPWLMTWKLNFHRNQKWTVSTTNKHNQLTQTAAFLNWGFMCSQQLWIIDIYFIFLHTLRNTNIMGVVWVSPLLVFPRRHVNHLSFNPLFFSLCFLGSLLWTWMSYKTCSSSVCFPCSA